MGVLIVLGAALGLGASAAQARSHGRRHHASSPPVVMNGYRCTVVATSRHPHRVGHAGAVVCGVSGNDVLKARGPGRVVLIGGPGNDKLIASRASGSQDTLIGGSGPDTMLTGTGGDDVVDTGAGNDAIECPNPPSASTGGDGGTSGNTGTGTDQSRFRRSRVRMAPSTLTVVGADAGDTENANCAGDTQNSASLEFQGTVNSTDGSTTMNITIQDNNDAAQAWLDANGDPTAVDISLVGASLEVDNGGSLVAGDDVEVAANANGSTLTAVDVQAQPPNSSGFDN